jgi:(1->4)-alpha-D-glucan 1-alpha-D-glucosylmutase
VLTTHDTKRSADVRARITVLSQAPEAARADPAGADPQLAWVARQTALGLGEVPEAAPRLADALLKAAREAALRTSWTEPDAAYERAVAGYARLPGELPPELAGAARANLLGMTALHLTMPGVPEVYQGAETEYRALVDPDNRRPARFPRAALARLDAGAAPDGPAEEKLALTAALLRLRRDRPELFTGYAPLRAEGPAAEHCLAFARPAGLVTVVTRLAHRLAEAGGWRGTGPVAPAAATAGRGCVHGPRHGRGAAGGLPRDGPAPHGRGLTGPGTDPSHPVAACTYGARGSSRGSAGRAWHPS